MGKLKDKNNVQYFIYIVYGWNIFSKSKAYGHSNRLQFY